MNVNRFIYQTHKWLGLLIASVLVIVGLTGSLLVFLDEVKQIDGQDQPVSVRAHRLSLDELIAQVRRQQPEKTLRGIDFVREPTLAYRVNLSQNGTNYTAAVDPYTGLVLTLYKSDSSLTGWIYRLHTSLALPPWGDLIVALTASLFTLSSLTGLWVQRKFLGRVFHIGIRRNKSIKTAYSDTHKLVGTLSLCTNLILGITGIYISLYAFDVEFLTEGPDKPTQTDRRTYPFSLDALLINAQARIPDFQLYYLSFPRTAGAPITFSGRIPFGNAVYTPAYSSADAQYSAVDGHLTVIHDLRREGFWTQADYFTHEFHYGKYAGWPVKILYFLGGLMPALLAVTGTVVWWRKRRRHGSRPIF